MNKTVTTNIGGLIFHVDEIAYETLSKYLETIRNYFANSEGRDEIITDIEARIAEMFNEKLNETKQVITQEDVDGMIAIMGRPEEFTDDQEAGTEDRATSSPAFDSRKRRRIFRDKENEISARFLKNDL